MKRRIQETDAYRQGDHVRVNILVSNNERYPQIVNYDSKIKDIEVDRSYYMAIERLVVTSALLPIFFYNDNDVYTVSVKKNATDYASARVQPSTNARTYDGVRCYWDYQTFLDDINTAFYAAFTLAGFSNPPSFVYNAEKSKIDMYVPTTNITNYPKIYINGTLTRFLQGFRFSRGPTSGTLLNPIAPDGFETQLALEFNLDAYSNLIYTDLFQQPLNPNVPNNHTLVEQEGSYLHAWNDITSLVIKTNMIPIREEYLPNNASNTRSENVSSSPVVTDLAMRYEENSRVGCRGQQYYTPETPRYIDVESGPLSKLQLSLFIRLRDATQRPYYIGVDESVQVKILFVKRDAVH